jgi:hypothetical protein
MSGGERRGEFGSAGGGEEDSMGVRAQQRLSVFSGLFCFLVTWSS